MKWNLLCLSFLLIACQNPQKTELQFDLKGKVVRIADGDTFTLLTSDQQQVRVRLHGIDAPERKQDFGQVARQALSDLIFEQVVYVDEQEKDRYGRVVGIVYDAGKNSVNEEMLRSGLAWHYERYDNNARWKQLQEEARQKRRGLWSQNHAIAPWEWRKEKADKAKSEE